MWITELAMNTTTADTRIGSHSDINGTVGTIFSLLVSWPVRTKSNSKPASAIRDEMVRGKRGRINRGRSADRADAGQARRQSSSRRGLPVRAEMGWLSRDCFPQR